MIINVLVFSESYIQIVQINKRKKRLIWLSSLPLTEKILSRGKILDKEKLKELISKLVNSSKIKIKEVIIVVEEDLVSSRTIKLPEKLEDSDISDAIIFEVEEFLPYPLKEMIIDWKKIEVKDGNQVLLFAVETKYINTYLEIMEELEIEVIGLETTALSLLRLAKQKEGVRILIYVDNDDLVMTLAKDDQIIASSILKKTKNFTSFLQDTVRRMLLYYRDFKVEWIQIGGMGLTKEVMDIVSRFGLKVVGFKPIYNIKEAEFNNYLLGISAASGEIYAPKDQRSINLLPEWYVKKYEDKGQLTFWTKLLGIWNFYTFILLIFLGGLFAWLFYKERELNYSQNLTPETRKEVVDEVNKANKYARLVLSLSESDYFPTKVVREIAKVKKTEITLMKSEVRMQEMMVDLSGIAENRDSLLIFKKSIEELSFVELVTLPVSSFNEEQNIPFQFNIKLKKDAFAIELSK